MIDYPLIPGPDFRPVDVPRLRVTSGPAVEPVTLAEAKSHIELYDTGKDTLVTALIVAARAYCEAIQNRAYITQTVEYTIDRFPDFNAPIVLPRPRLQSVTSAKYTTKDGPVKDLDMSLVIVDAKSEPGRLVLNVDKEWPSDDLAATNALVITYKAGYGDAATAVPTTIQHAIKFLVAAWFDQRSAIGDQSSGNVTELPLAFWSLIALDRIARFA